MMTSARVGSSRSAIRSPGERAFYSTSMNPIYGPTLAASGVTAGVVRPTKQLTLLSPEFAVQTLPEGSTATPIGALREPKPVEGDRGAV
jgi:hypothetical protein